MLFEVTADHIKLLNDADLRELIGRLAGEEVRRQGHSPAAVTWGGHQNAKDGGIDVRVSLPSNAQITGYVPAAATGFQVKAQDMPRQAIIDEMAPGGTLRESIADLAAQSGAYIIVSSHGSVADEPLQERKEAMSSSANGAGGSLTVEFYDRRKVASWVNLHPGLVPWVRERVARPLTGWHPFADWSSSPAPLDKPYLLDGDVRLHCPSRKDADGFSAEDGIRLLRQLLSAPKGIVRLVGLSGVGKTRLVQALFDERVGEQPLPDAEAVYTDLSEGSDPMPLELASSLINLNHRAILIIDNCPPDLHQKLAARIANADCKLSVITIEYDITDDKPENTDVFKLEPASVGLVEKILEAKFPHILGPSRDVIAKFSDGNARIAIALAQTAKDGESLANLHDTQLFRRLFEQSKTPSEELLSAAKACALLYSFDGVTLDGPNSELSALGSLAGLSADVLYKHVADLARRQLVQKRSNWRAILPHAIAHRLAKLALEDIPFQRIEANIINSGSERMLRSFSKRMGYLHDNERAKALAATWFAEKGFLEPLGNYNELGKALFVNIAPVDPVLTLAFIERKAAGNPSFFEAANPDRSEILRVLRLIGFDAVLFDRAAALLGRFAAHADWEEKDKASETLQSLFHLYLSGTHATAAQRAAIIRQFLESNKPAETQFGLKLLGTMLGCGPFSSFHPFEFGARPRDYGFYPRGQQIADWYRDAIKAASDISLSSEPIAADIRKRMAQRFGELCSRVGLIEELVALGETYDERFGWAQGWVGVRSAIRRCKGKVEDVRLAKLEALAERLRPSNLADTIRTYALYREWGPLDIASLDEEDGETRTEARQRIYETCTDLGAQLGQDQAQLESLLPEMLGSDSHKTRNIGLGLAAGCPSLTACWSAIERAFLALEGKPRWLGLLGGFMDGARNRNPDETEILLDGLLAKPAMQPHFVYLQTSAGLKSKAFERLMAALRLESVSPSDYNAVAYGKAHAELSDEEMRSLANGLLEKEDAAAVVVEIVGMRIYGAVSDKLPVSETLKAAGRDLLERFPFQEKKVQGDHMLGVITRASLDKPEHEDLARRVCERIIDAARDFRISAWDMGETITALVTAFPRASLDIFVEEDEGYPYRGSRMVFHDIREHHRACPLQAMPEATWMSWADEKPDLRYTLLAGAVRYSDANDDDKSSAWSSAAERIINTAPNPSKALDIFFERFTPMSWSGSRAEIFASRILLMEALLHHPRAEVASWAKAKMPELRQAVEKMREREAREDRSRDERFE